MKKANQNDYKRFINKVSATDEGEVAENDFYFIDTQAIGAEEAFDGFYAVCTNLEDHEKNFLGSEKIENIVAFCAIDKRPTTLLSQWVVGLRLAIMCQTQDYTPNTVLCQ